MDRKGTCKASSCTVGLAQGSEGSVTGYKGVSTDSEQALVSAVPQQPVPIAIEADQPSLSIGMKSSCIGASVLLSKASAATPGPKCDLMWVHFKTKYGKVVLENVLRPVLLQRQMRGARRASDDLSVGRGQARYEERSNLSCSFSARTLLCDRRQTTRS